MKNTQNEIEQQRRYYAETSSRYDAMHVNKKDEHFFALSFLAAAVDYLAIRSILDIGSGTGRAVRYLKAHRPGIRVVGIEPVKELREEGYLHGLSQEDLIDGDATKLHFSRSGFDLVCAFGVLHHIRRPEVAVSEMLRVSDKAVFISDSNNFGQGRGLSRSIKQLINSFGLWPLANRLKTRGRGYSISDGDGVAYSYSVFNNYKQIKGQCKSVHLFNTMNAEANIYKTAGHVALLGIKK